MKLLPSQIATTETFTAAVIPGFSGDASSTAGTTSLTLATVNSNTGTFGSVSAVPVLTVNAKGLVTSVGTAALGTVAVKNTGTSGNVVPLLDGSNTWSAAQTFSGNVGMGVSPSSRLDISGTGGIAGGIAVRNSTAASYSSITMYDERNSNSYVSQWGLYGSSGSNPNAMFFYNTAGAGIGFYVGSGTPASDLKMMLLSTGLSITGTLTSSGNLSAANFSGSSSGTNTGDQTTITGNAGTATKWQTARTLSWTGDATGSSSVDGSANVSISMTLATVNSNTGSFGINSGVAGSNIYMPQFTVDAKGRITAASHTVLGTAASYYTGTSGNAVPLLNGVNVWSNNQSITSAITAWSTGTVGTQVGNLHIGTSSSTANAGPAITFGARDASGAQAGIYVNTDSSYGTKMYLATTNSYSAGAQVALAIDHTGAVSIPKAGLTVSGTITASNFSGSSSGTNTGDQTNIPGNAATATNVAWSGVTGKPTTVAGYGITDAVSTGVTNTFTAPQTFSGNQTIPSAPSGNGSIFRYDGGGLALQGQGTTYDFILLSRSQQMAMALTANTKDLVFGGAGSFTGNITAANLGTASAKNTGTSGNTVPLLDGTNTWSGPQTLSAMMRITTGAETIRMPGSGPYLSFFSANEATRYGYLQGTAAGLNLASESGSLTFSANGTIYLYNPSNGTYIQHAGVNRIYTLNNGMGVNGYLTFNNIRDGLVSSYDAGNTQAIWAMGPGFTLGYGGSTSYGSHYGLAWSYEPDYNGAGNNPQSKAGLSHQMLLQHNGITKTAIGNGIWTSGNIIANGLGVGTTPTYKFEVLNSSGTSAKIRKGVAGGDNLVLDNVNSATTTNWIKFTTDNESYTYGTISTDSYAIRLGAQFNIQLSPGIVGGSSNAGVIIGYNDYTSTPASKLGVLTGATGQVGINVLGRPSQTANLQQWGIYTAGDGTSNPITYTTLAYINASGAGTFTGVTSTSITNNGALGSNAANARNHFTQSTLGTTSPLSAGWIAAAFGDASANRVVIGQGANKAIIGSHTGNLDNWADIYYQSTNHYWLNGAASTIMTLNGSGSLTLTGTLSASNFSGSHSGTSSGTNTGDQTNITGNAGTSTKSGLLTYTDTRSVTDAPQDKVSYAVQADFKSAGSVANPPVQAGSGFAHVLSLSGWVSGGGGGGGQTTQISTGDGLAVRQSTSQTAWGPWRTLLHDGNYTSYSPSLTGTGASGTWAINITGSASSATTLSKFIASDLNNPVAADTVASNVIGYVNANISLYGQNDGALFGQAHNSNWQHQIYGDYRTGQIAIRGKNNGTWQAWRNVLDSSNYTSYAPSLTGSGASGTWSINISGTAAAVPWSGITGKPFNYSGQSGQPTWVWGTNDGGTYYVWNPINFSVARIYDTRNTVTSGSTRLARRDNNTDYSVQTYFTGSRWRLYGYSGDTEHADTHVGYSEDSAKLQGYTSDVEANANTIVRRDANGYVKATNIVSSGATDDSTAMTKVFYGTSGDNIVRPRTLGVFAKQALESSYSGAVIGNGSNTKLFQFRSNYNVNDSSGAPLQAFSDNGSGAVMSFHRSGTYAINMGLDSDNVFRIGGWSAGASRLQMDMSGNLTMAGNVTAYSDIRLKYNIRVITGALDLVCRMQGVRFNRVDTGKESSGVIAQHLEQVAPELVQTDAEGMKSVSYGNAAGYFIEAIKELKDQVDRMSRRILELEARS